MAPTVTPDVAPLFSKDRSQSFQQLPKKRANPIALILMVVMLVLIGGGIVRNLAKPQQKVETVKIVGAAVDLTPGTRLNYHSLHYVSLPKDYVTDEMMTRSSEAVGRVVKVFIARGEPISESEVMSANQTLQSIVETHERAISLKLDDDSLVDHNLYPGDNVDVIVTATKDSSKYTKTICQKVRVLLSLSKEALASTAARNEDRNKITLAVSPEQAELLSEAMETGKIRLVLRNRLATGVRKLYGASEGDLLPGQAFADQANKAKSKTTVLPFLPAPPPPVFSTEPLFSPPPAPVQDALGWVVEVFQGSRKETHEFAKKTQ